MFRGFLALRRYIPIFLSCSRYVISFLSGLQFIFDRARVHKQRCPKAYTSVYDENVNLKFNPISTFCPKKREKENKWKYVNNVKWKKWNLTKFIFGHSYSTLRYLGKHCIAEIQKWMFLWVYFRVCLATPSTLWILGWFILKYSACV